MTHEFDTARPIYLQLSELLTQAIVSGEFSPGQRLLGVRELAMQYGVNPNTVQRCMAELERNGLVYSERTAGRFVTKDAERIAAIRKADARKQAILFLKKMANLGINDDEMRGLLAEAATKIAEGENGD